MNVWPVEKCGWIGKSPILVTPVNNQDNCVSISRVYLTQINLEKKHNDAGLKSLWIWVIQFPNHHDMLYLHQVSNQFVFKFISQLVFERDIDKIQVKILLIYWFICQIKSTSNYLQLFSLKKLSPFTCGYLTLMGVCLKIFVGASVAWGVKKSRVNWFPGKVRFDITFREEACCHALWSWTRNTQQVIPKNKETNQQNQF